MCKMGASKRQYQEMTESDWDLEDEEYFYEQYKIKNQQQHEYNNENNA